MDKHSPQDLSCRRQLEQHMVDIVSCLGALCDTHISVYTDTEKIRNGEAASGGFNVGYNVDLISEHFQFELEFIEIKEICIAYAGDSIFHADLGVRLTLPTVIENLLRSAYSNILFPDAEFAVTGRARLQLEQLDFGTFIAALKTDFVDFQFDSMTDTMLRSAYPFVLKSLAALMPWIKFVHFLADQHYDREHLVNMQVEFCDIMEQAVVRPKASHAHVFALCDLAGSFDPALRLFQKPHSALFP